MTDLIVVGGGIMGAPAAFHAASSGAHVTVIASPEPHDPASHTGVFGAHYDQTRLMWRWHPDPVETQLAVRSLDTMHQLENGASIMRHTGVLYGAQPGRGLAEQEWQAARHEDRFGIEILDGREIRRRWPVVHVPDDTIGYFEPPPAGIIDPRRLIAEFLRQSGAELIPDMVINISADGSGCRVTTVSGLVLSAPRCLVAAGAFTNRPGLLPRQLAVRLKSETIVFAEVPPEQRATYMDVPPMHLDLEPADVAEIYTTPLTATPDGRWRLKLGANTARDQWLDGPDAAAEWYRQAGTVNPLPVLRRAMLDLYPQLDSTVWRTERCVIAYTAHGNPYIDVITPGRLFVATGGNGRAAKWGPELGRIAAQLALHGDWNHDLPRQRFRVVFAEDVTGWARPDLLANR